MKRFKSEAPEKLLSLINKEYTVLEKKMSQTQQIMGHLNNIANPNAKLPKVKYYTWVEGTIDMFEDMLKEWKTVYWTLYTSVENINEEILKYLEESYIPRRIKSWMITRALVNNTKDWEYYLKVDKKRNRKTILLPSNLYPFATDINIYGNKVAFYSYSDLSWTIIENENIKNTIFSLYKTAWNLWKELEINEHYKNIEI